VEVSSEKTGVGAALAVSSWVVVVVDGADVLGAVVVVVAIAAGAAVVVVVTGAVVVVVGGAVVVVVAGLTRPSGPSMRTTVMYMLPSGALSAPTPT
jgi:hypothetical protein